jgi:tRNA-dependent cyclodipeptide synthase
MQEWLMRILELSALGEKILESRGAALIGLSIRNHYFRGDTIENLTQWGSCTFGTLVFMVPDEPAIDTLLGLGYDPGKAKAQAMLASNNLTNKCERAISKFGISNRARIVRWAQLTANAAYCNSLASVSALYEDNELFRNDVRDTTRQVMLSQGTKLPIDDAVEIGAGFLLKELSFIVAASEILKLSGPSAYLYHRPAPVLKNLLSGKYSFGLASSSCGYIVCTLERVEAAGEQLACVPSPVPAHRTPVEILLR